MSTQQNIFDHVWDYFLTDKNDFGWNEAGGLCEYRTPDGAKCAIGCMIPDEYYDKNMEGNSADDLFGDVYRDIDLTGHIEERFGSIRDVPNSFFDRLQHVHDHAAECGHGKTKEEVRDTFRQYMTNVANEIGLDIPC